MQRDLIIRNLFTLLKIRSLQIACEIYSAGHKMWSDAIRYSVSTNCWSISTWMMTFSHSNINLKCLVELVVCTCTLSRSWVFQPNSMHYSCSIESKWSSSGQIRRQWYTESRISFGIKFIVKDLNNQTLCMNASQIHWNNVRWVGVQDKRYLKLLIESICIQLLLVN